MEYERHGAIWPAHPILQTTPSGEFQEAINAHQFALTSNGHRQRRLETCPGDPARSKPHAPVRYVVVVSGGKVMTVAPAGSANRDAGGFAV
jgi:hypothetical protein